MTSSIKKEDLAKAIMETLDNERQYDTYCLGLLELARKLKIRLTGGWDNADDFIPDWTNVIKEWSGSGPPTIEGGTEMHDCSIMTKLGYDAFSEKYVARSIYLQLDSSGKFVVEVINPTTDKYYLVEIFDVLEFADSAG